LGMLFWSENCFWGTGGFKNANWSTSAYPTDPADDAGFEASVKASLRDMIRIPSESCQEKDVILRIKQEMEKVGFDKVEIDPMGNVIGTLGHGPRLIALDGHIDTVGIGNRANWKFDPYEGYEDEETIGGRGASDQEGGMASMVYAAKIIKDLKLEGADALVLSSCVQMPSLAAVPIVEKECGLPVVSAAICTTYQMLRKLSLSTWIPETGRLLSGAY